MLEQGSKVLQNLTYFLLKTSRKNLFVPYISFQPKNKTRDLPKLSIIFPNYDGDKTYLKTLLKSIMGSNYTKAKIETVMADNGSTNDSVAFVKKSFPWVKIITLKENMGFAKAVNIGVKKSNGTYIFITNNDIKLEKDCLKNLVKFLLTNPKVGVVGAKVNDYKNRSKISSSALAYSFLTGSFVMSKKTHRTQEADWVIGCSLCTSKKLWQKLGGFDEGFFFTGEELDFCLRVKYAGLKIVYLPKALLWHVGGLTINRPQLQKLKYFEVYKSKFRLIFKHANILQVISALILQFLVFTPYKTLILREKSFTLMIRALIWNFKNLPVRIKPASKQT